MSNIFVIPQEGEWAIRWENSTKIISVHDSKKEALEEAKELVMGTESVIVILREDGTIDNLGAYEIDPFPSDDNTPDYNTNEDDEENIE